MKSFVAASLLILTAGNALAQDAPNRSGDNKPGQETRRIPMPDIKLLPGIPVFMGVRPGQPAKLGAVDPSHYQALPLLLRGDVRGEIGVSVAQRETIEELVKKDKPLGGRNRPLKIESHSGDETDVRDKIQQMINSSLDESNKTVETLLHRDQIQRLHQLDLQWRGGLALADKSVAEALNLSGDQQSKAAELLQVYREQQSAITMEVYKDFMDTQQQNDKGDNGEVRKMVSMRLRIPDRKEMTPTQRLKFDEMEEKIEKIRKTQNAQALALLAPEQKAAWQKLQGKPFSFRARD